MALPAAGLAEAANAQAPDCTAAGSSGWGSLVVSGHRGIGLGIEPDAGQIALDVSRDWSVTQPDITRAVITIHGARRDAGHYDRIARNALAMAGRSGCCTLLVTPEFDGDHDVCAGPERLRWRGNRWMDGEPASGHSRLSSFDVIDAIIGRLRNRTLFPFLKMIVLVGHSAGGQLVQRYAVLTRADDHQDGGTAAPAAAALRYVVANPSSYSYFSADRPIGAGGFGPFPASACPEFDRWKYGLETLPPYAAPGIADLERSYVHRDVVYLLGQLDTDPDLAALDRSCAAEAQGPNHLERGRAFFRYLRARHPGDLRQRLCEVPRVGHDAEAMLTSSCALSAIYDMAAMRPVTAPGY